MIDEMTAMSEEISKLKAEVERLRDALQSVLDNLPEAGTYDFEISRSNTTIQRIVSTALFAANVTSEEPQASEPKFKVGDEVIWQGDKLKVSNIFFDDDCSMWCYDFEDFDFCAIESALERA